MDAYGCRLSSRSTPTGPGSRGGRWHLPEHRNAYQRAWRRANPEYREREALRHARRQAVKRGDDPATVTVPARFPRPMPVVVAPCTCPECRCANEVPVVACGMCLEGMHA